MPGMRAMPLAEVPALLRRLPVKYAALAAIGVTTGARITEILALRRFDLLEPDGKLKDRIQFLRLKTGCGAGGKTPARHRFIGIPGAYRPYVLRHLAAEEERGWERPDDYVFRGQRGSHLSRHTVYDFFRGELGRGHGTHWMRKTFAQNLFRYYLGRNAADPMRALELTRRALGHERLDTTVRYLGIMDETLETAQNAIFKEIDDE